MLVFAGCGVSKPGHASGPSADSSTDVTVPDAGFDGDAVMSCSATEQTCWAAAQARTQYGCTDHHCLDSDGGLRATNVAFGSCGIDMSTTETDAGPSDLPRWAGAIEVNDDSCAFHVRVLPRCTANARELSLAVQLSSLQSGNLIAGANPYVLVFEGLTHLAPPSGTKMTETTPGVYEIGPIVFDIPGPWTITIHFFGTCVETNGSPHTHVSLLVNVP